MTDTPWAALAREITRLSDRVDGQPVVREATVVAASPLSVLFDTDDSPTLVFRTLTFALTPGDRVLTLQLRHYVWVLGVQGGGVPQVLPQVMPNGTNPATLPTDIQRSYYINGTGGTASWYPGGVAGNYIYDVKPLSPGDPNVVQVATEWGDRRRWTRITTNGGATWSAWVTQAASQAEVNAGTRADVFVTPATLKNRAWKGSDRPLFRAYKTGGNQDISGAEALHKVTFQTASANQGSHYSTANSRFTAPVSGLYFFTFGLATSGTTSTGPEAYLAYNGSALIDTSAIGYYTAWNNFGNSIPLRIGAGGYVEVFLRNNNGSTVSLANARCNFSGYLVEED